MAQAANTYNKKPRELSFKLTLQFINAFRQAGQLLKNGKINPYLIKAIVYKKVGNRPKRQEPRRVKRRPKIFPHLQKARHLYHYNKQNKNAYA